MFVMFNRDNSSELNFNSNSTSSLFIILHFFIFFPPLSASRSLLFPLYPFFIINARSCLTPNSIPACFQPRRDYIIPKSAQIDIGGFLYMHLAQANNTRPECVGIPPSRYYETYFNRHD